MKQGSGLDYHNIHHQYDNFVTMITLIRRSLGRTGVSLAVGRAAIVAPTVKLRFADMIYGIQRWQR